MLGLIQADDASRGCDQGSLAESHEVLEPIRADYGKPLARNTTIHLAEHGQGTAGRMARPYTTLSAFRNQRKLCTSRHPAPHENVRPSVDIQEGLKQLTLQSRPSRPESQAIKRAYIPPFRRSQGDAARSDHRQARPSPLERNEGGRGIPLSYQENLKTHVSSLIVDPQIRLPCAHIQDVQFVGSYKWIEPPLEHTQPTLLVPGLPKIWEGRNSAKKRVRRDNEPEGNVEYADHNAIRTPSGVNTHDPNFLALTCPQTLHGTSLLTGRNNLKTLFSFCADALKAGTIERSQSSRMTTVRIDAELISGTDLIILHRWTPKSSNRPREPAHYHLAFHEENTMCIDQGTDRTPGCHSIIRYDFDGLKMMVKHDVRAALPWPELYGRKSPGEDGHREGSPDEEDETMSLVGDTDAGTCATWNSFHSSGPTTTTLGKVTSTGIRIVPGGIPFPPQGHLISLKTRSIPNSVADDTKLELANIYSLEETFAGVYFGQTPNLFLATHHHGVFAKEIQRHLLGDGELRKLEEKYDRVLRWMRSVLGWMVVTTRWFGKVSFVGQQGEMSAFELDADLGRLGEEAERVIEHSAIRLVGAEKLVSGSVTSSPSSSSPRL